MKVKELIDKLKEFDSELEVVSYSDYDECGNGTIECVKLHDVYDPDTGDETGNYNVKIYFEWDGDI